MPPPRSGGLEDRVLHILSDGTVTLEGLTITGGNALDNATSYDGGGIYNEGTLEVRRSTITGNNTDGYGGGILNTGTATIVESTISNNYASESGGGVGIGGDTTIISSTLSGNITRESGGAIDVRYGAPTALVIGSTLSGNQANNPDDIQALELNIDAGQTITVVVTPLDDFQATIDITDPSGNSIGTTIAETPGQTAIVQTVPTDAAGLYTTAIGSTANQTGNFEVEVFLNTAIEVESLGGPANDTINTAEDIDGSFINLGSPESTRGAVKGNILDDPDVYSFTLSTDDVVTLTVDDDMELELLDSEGNVIATAVPGPENVDQVIENFQVDTDGVFYARVSSDLRRQSALLRQTRDRTR